MKILTCYFDFANEIDGWNYSLEISDAVSGSDMIIPVTVPFEFDGNEVIQTVSRSIGVTGVFTDYERMSAGTYCANVQIGLQAL